MQSELFKARPSSCYFAGESLQWHRSVPDLSNGLQDCSGLDPSLSFRTHPVPPASHSLCSSHSGLPCNTPSSCPSAGFILAVSHFPCPASPSLRSGLKGLPQAVLAISSLAHRPVHVGHSAHHSLKCSYFSFFFFSCLSIPNRMH